METDLWISSGVDLSKQAYDSVVRYRQFIEEYIRQNPGFLPSFEPLAADPTAPPIIQDMLIASSAAGVGPMASVAGAIAQYVGKDLLKYSDEIIVENGGDIYLKTDRDIRVGIFAGDSRLSMKVVLRIRNDDMPLGICTSSGTIGHSISLGKADAVCVVSGSAVLADAAATAVGNLIQGKSDIVNGLKKGMSIRGVRGLVIIVENKMGLMGEVEVS